MKCDLNFTVHKQEHLTSFFSPYAVPFCIKMEIEDKE